MTQGPNAGRSELQRMLEAVLPEGVVCASGTDPSTANPLFPEEQAAVGQMHPSRLAEFTLGRNCARKALRRLGEPEVAIPRGPKQEPCWPAGISGSLSHTEGFCIAVVGRQPEIQALGVDVEARAPTHPRALDRIATAGERQHLAELNRNHGDINWSRLLFSAKECVYKAQFTLTEQPLRFHDVDIRFDPLGRFTVDIGDNVPEAERARGTGSFVTNADYAVTLFVVRAFGAPYWIRTRPPKPSS